MVLNYECLLLLSAGGYFKNMINQIIEDITIERDIRLKAHQGDEI